MGSERKRTDWRVSRFHRSRHAYTCQRPGRAVGRFLEIGEHCNPLRSLPRDSAKEVVRFLSCYKPVIYAKPSRFGREDVSAAGEGLPS